MSRRNDPTIPAIPGPNQAPNAVVDQVRNGNRWRVVAVNVGRSRLTAERLSDRARVTVGGDYLLEHVSLGYAAAVHSAQGVTTDTALAVLGDNASRAMAYVALTRGRTTNPAFIYQRSTGEADHQHSTAATCPRIHTMSRGNSYSAAHQLRAILANDNRPTTMHTIAEQTHGQHLPRDIAELLANNDDRRTRRHLALRSRARADARFRGANQRLQRDRCTSTARTVNAKLTGLTSSRQRHAQPRVGQSVALPPNRRVVLSDNLTGFRSAPHVAANRQI